MVVHLKHKMGTREWQIHIEYIVEVSYYKQTNANVELFVVLGEL